MVGVITNQLIMEEGFGLHVAEAERESVWVEATGRQISDHRKLSGTGNELPLSRGM